MEDQAGALELAELAANLLEELPGGESSGLANARVAMKAGLDGFFNRHLAAGGYDYSAAKAKRDRALGQAFDLALRVNQPCDVYHLAGGYRVGLGSEAEAISRQGWLHIGQVAP